MASEPKVTAQQIKLAKETYGVEGVVKLLCQNYERPIERFIYHRLYNRDCIDPNCHKFDVTQEAFWALSNELVKYDGDATDFRNLNGWLYRVSKNKVCDHFKLGQCWNLLPSLTDNLDAGEYSLSDKGQSASRIHYEQEFGNLFEQAKKFLSVAEQRILEARAIGLSCAEIAAMLGIKESTARQRVYRAARKFKQALKKLGFDFGGENYE